MRPDGSEESLPHDPCPEAIRAPRVRDGALASLAPWRPSRGASGDARRAESPWDPAFALGLLLVVLVGGLLRLHRLDAFSLWDDEARTFLLCALGNPVELVRAIPTLVPVSPPLDLLIRSAVMSVLGRTTFVFNLTSALFSTAVSFAALLSAPFLLHAARPSARTATVTMATFFMIVPLPSIVPLGRAQPGPSRASRSGQTGGNSFNPYQHTRDYFGRMN